jgi:uncharacterized ion transporter superfamily protein YfcC
MTPEQSKAQSQAEYAKYKATYREGETFNFSNPPIHSAMDFVGFGLMCGFVAMLVGMFFQVGTIAFITVAIVSGVAMKLSNDSAWEAYNRNRE